MISIRFPVATGPATHDVPALSGYPGGELSPGRRGMSIRTGTGTHPLEDVVMTLGRGRVRRAHEWTMVALAIAALADPDTTAQR